MGTHRIHWSVSLNNGETYHEETGNYKTVPGQRSPWQRLLLYIAENKLSITAVTLRSIDGKTYNLPSAGNNPKFKEYAEAPKPIAYNMFRKAAADIIDGKLKNQELYTVAEATYEDGNILQLWVDNKTLNAWTLYKTGGRYENRRD